MKLKQAIKEAMLIHEMFGHEINYIAVDKNREIYGYSHKPLKKSDYWSIDPAYYHEIGYYGGSKKWYKTLRKVK